MSMTARFPKKDTPPHCEECGAGKPMAVKREGVTDEQIAASLTGMGLFDWLCGSCLYKRTNPDAAPAIPLPREREPLPLQSERLFEP